MKTLILFLFLPLSVLAADCAVDGISDSPQSYTCMISLNTRVEKLRLLCVNGAYRLEWMDKAFDISVAYHEEVEVGSTPLVFRSETLSLKTIAQKSFSRGTLTVGGKEFKGLCY